jgi:hypothetical protein
MILDDVLAQTDRLVSKTQKEIVSWYFVTAHTINGGRFYSEPFKTLDSAMEQYDSLKDMTKYFGGGLVELLMINDFDYDVIAISRI